jgi:hypothetical protein
MEMMNRAIEDASDFVEMKRRMLERAEPAMRAADFERTLADAAQNMRPEMARPPKRHGENRQQYRARLRALEAAKE